MAFTGQLATVNSKLGSIELGVLAVAAPVGSSTPPGMPPFTGGPWVPGAPWSRPPLFLRISVPLQASGSANRTPYPFVREMPDIKGAPWIRLPKFTPLPQKGVPTVPLPVPPYPTIRGGPWMPGAPWSQLSYFAGFRSASPSAPVPAPAARVVTLPLAMPALIRGPWSILPTMLPPVPTVPPGFVPPPPIIKQSHIHPFIARIPDAEPRLRRFTEIVSQILNSLMGEGSIVQDTPASWTLKASTTGLTGTFQ